MSELIISRKELPILVNDLHCNDGGDQRIVYPFYGERLFNLDTKALEIKDIIDSQKFNGLMKEMTPSGIDPRQMVSFNDLRDGLVSSNVIGYRNEQDVIDWFRKLKSESMDPSIRPKPFFIALDTNIFYGSFVSRHLSFQDSDKYPFCRGFRYMISDIVRDEIDACVEHKYSHDEIEAFKSTFKRRDLLNEFRNGSDLRARRAKLAFNECEFLRKELKAIGTSGRGSTNKEANDREIARSYMRHAKENNYDVCLLTADEDMVTHARTCDMASKQLLHQVDIPKRCKIDPWLMHSLIYDLTVRMGAISIENDGTIVLLGEWKGKTSADYTDENVKVLIDDPDRYSRVNGELEICRKICEIMRKAA